MKGCPSDSCCKIPTSKCVFVRLPAVVPQKQNFKHGRRAARDLLLLRNQFLAELYGVGCVECALAYQSRLRYLILAMQWPLPTLSLWPPSNSHLPPPSTSQKPGPNGEGAQLRGEAVYEGRYGSAAAWPTLKKLPPNQQTSVTTCTFPPSSKRQLETHSILGLLTPKSPKGWRRPSTLLYPVSLLSQWQIQRSSSWAT